MHILCIGGCIYLPYALSNSNSNSNSNSRTEAAATNKAKFSPDTTAAKMAEIRESQKQVEESVRRAKVKLSDMHSDTQTKLSEAKKQIEKIREKEWNQ
jgi:hypothetical protein